MAGLGKAAVSGSKCRNLRIAVHVLAVSKTQSILLTYDKCYVLQAMFTGLHLLAECRPTIGNCKLFDGMSSKKGSLVTQLASEGRIAMSRRLSSDCNGPASLSLTCRLVWKCW